jgi:hypothetical protein
MNIPTIRIGIATGTAIRPLLSNQIASSSIATPATAIQSAVLGPLFPVWLIVQIEATAVAILEIPSRIRSIEVA